VSEPTTPGPSGGPRGKRATRKTLLALRDALTPGTRDAASRDIAARVNAVIDRRLAAGSVIALYAAKGTEVETALIDVHATAAGMRVAYPRIVPGDRTLAFHAAARTELVAARFGLREPRADAPGITLEQVAAFVIPGIAFDRTGGRIGWGRGYYDATLMRAPAALRLGLAFECQLVDHVAREPHDIAVHYILTEVATYAVA
jgi:5-formyltetrahydrofolate cyclo-ligase